MLSLSGRPARLCSAPSRRTFLCAGGLAVGASLAIQGPVSNYGAGLSIILGRLFRVGDTIEVVGCAGVVTEISLGTTRLRTDDGEEPRAGDRPGRPAVADEASPLGLTTRSANEIGVSVSNYNYWEPIDSVNLSGGLYGLAYERTQALNDFFVMGSV